ncbi:NepR family anti-sigma factor [Erythrobacter sp. MTPC3]|uniref:NepR family anti-sigma factor n=1 Tax=Erythrobacter sp. MTPC3 TaxID=3056564 RepID=UPI0036F30DCE
MPHQNDKSALDTGHGASAKKDRPPDWANGLRSLYDSVVDEPLPDSFKDLLAQLDESDDGSPSSGAGSNN